MLAERKYINDYHRKTSEAIAKEIIKMKENPLTLEQKIAQMQRLNPKRASHRTV